MGEIGEPTPTPHCLQGGGSGWGQTSIGSQLGWAHLGWVGLGTTAWKGGTSCLCVLTSKKSSAFWAKSHKQPQIRPPSGSLEENKELEDSPGNETFLHLLRSAAAALFNRGALCPDPPASPALQLLAPRRPQPAAQLGLEAAERQRGRRGEVGVSRGDEEDGECTCACKDTGGRLHDTRLEQRQFEQSHPVMPRTRRVPARVLNHHLGRARRNKCRDASLLCVLCRVKIALDGGKLQVAVTRSDACPLAHLLGLCHVGRDAALGAGVGARR